MTDLKKEQSAFLTVLFDNANTVRIFSERMREYEKTFENLCNKGGITYLFDNGQIITFQDNFKYLVDVPFTVYFDFEMTTGNLVFCFFF